MIDQVSTYILVRTETLKIYAELQKIIPYNDPWNVRNYVYLCLETLILFYLMHLLPTIIVCCWGYCMLPHLDLLKKLMILVLLSFNTKEFLLNDRGTPEK